MKKCGTRNRAERLWALNLPQRVTVELDAEGQPRAARLSMDKSDSRAVEGILEIWRIDDDWWRAPISRRYYELMLDGGKRVVLFEDLVTGEWWMQKPA